MKSLALKAPISFLILAVFAFALPAEAQSYPTAPQASGMPASSSGDIATLLARIEQETQGLNADVGKLRIEKWKTDSSSKYQSTENAASIQRNITAALPALITAVRATPQSLAANFKLYRNLNALYDVTASLGESAAAFGKREEYETIAPHVSALDSNRRTYGDYLQQMANSADIRLAAAQQQARAAAVQQAPKKIIVDDNEPATPIKKKRTKKSAATPSPAATSPK